MSRDHSDELGERLGELAGADRPTVDQLRRFAGAAATSSRSAGARAVASGRWLAETTLDAASRVPIRDHATLIAHHDGLDGEALAVALVHSASRASATVGAGFGALAAASELTPATWTALPIELLAETMAVVAIELKLVGELHAVAGRPVEGAPAERAALLASAWADGRGITTTRLLRGVRAVDVAGRQARQRLVEQLRKRLLRRAGRNLATWVPFFAGAAAGAELNRRATRALGNAMATDLKLRA